MRLADFILTNVELILCEWEIFARNIGAGNHLDKLKLRDHAEEILLATAQDMKLAQSPAERALAQKELNLPYVKDALDNACDAHAVDRLGLGFDMLEVMSEYRALRTSVLQLWHRSDPGSDERDVEDLSRFNESIDRSLSGAVAGYTKRVDQARDMFLAILSHDLRNPLGAISMSAQLLPMSCDDKAEIVEYGSIIANSASAMERMINDLLDYTRTRLGAGIPVNPTPMDLGVLGQELIVEFRTANPHRNIEFSAVGDLNGSWDFDRVRQAVSNLLGNAVQHGSSQFPITLSLSGVEESVIINVHNGGDLIPPGELPKIFDPLIRGSSAEHPMSNRPGSIGMGLYIAREVAKSHKGRIDVYSTLKTGTSFIIRLPRHTAPKIGDSILDAKHIEVM